MPLGTGSYRAYVTDRGGVNVFYEVTDIIRIRAEWERDEVSDCEIWVAPKTDECCRQLAETKTVRMELVLYRDGKRVFEGPITRLSYEKDRIEISARCVVWYLSRRALELDLDYRDGNVNYIDVLYQTLQYHYPAQNDPFNIGPFLQKINCADDATTAGRFVRYGESLHDLLDGAASDGGVDYVVRGRAIIIYDTHAKIKVLPRMTDADFFESLRVVEYGSDLKTRVVSTNNDNVVRVGEAPQQWLDYYGPIDEIRNNTDEEEGPLPEPTEKALDDSAYRALLKGYPAPVNVLIPSNIGVRPTVSVEFEDLLPGAIVPVEATQVCRSLVQYQRIHSTKVEWEADVDESVSITFVQAPATLVDPL